MRSPFVLSALITTTMTFLLANMTALQADDSKNNEIIESDFTSTAAPPATPDETDRTSNPIIPGAEPSSLPVPVELIGYPPPPNLYLGPKGSSDGGLSDSGNAGGAGNGASDGNSSSADSSGGDSNGSDSDGSDSGKEGLGGRAGGLGGLVGGLRDGLGGSGGSKGSGGKGGND